MFFVELIKQISTHRPEAVQNALRALGANGDYLGEENWQKLTLSSLENVLTFLIVHFYIWYFVI